jgi:hypothetical protein
MMDISLFKGLTSGEVAGLIAVGIFIGMALVICHSVSF